MRRLRKLVAMASLVLFLGYTGFVISRASETICNGKKGENKLPCGEKRACDGVYPGCFNGTAVVSVNSFTNCGDGSANEYCVEQQDTCTETFYCEEDTETSTCVPNDENPLLDSEGDPVVSTEVRGVVKSCTTG